MLPAFLLGLSALALPVAAHNKDLDDILEQAGKSSLYKYPTSFTQDIIPKGLHSHNDYWRPVPLYSALAAGAISVESDVWLVDGELYVGHDRSSLTKDRTFTSLYVKPLLEVLKRQNPKSSFVPEATRYGVYDAGTGQTLYLFVDLKTDGATTWPVVIKQLEPLRAAGYLTVFDGSKVIPGPVTVIGTGSTPLNQVLGVAPRDYFYDGPLADLARNPNITAAVSPVASTSFKEVMGEVRGQTFNETQVAKLKAQVDTAHARGIKTRYWETPGWPVGTRNAVWRIMWENGVDLVNVDDLEAATKFWDMN